MKNFGEINHAQGAVKTWKKVLIIALCVVAAAALTFAVLLCQVYYDKHHKVTYWEGWSEQLSPNIVVEYGYIGMEGFEQLKDIRTGEYTTPKLQHVFVNEYNAEDSLVVFRTHDRLRGYLNVNTGKIVIPAQYNRAWNFSEGIAAVYKDGFVSFIRENGEPAFPKTYPIRYDDDYSEIAFQFHNGLCVMRTMNNKWGLINTNGEWVIEPTYNTIDAPYHGYRRVYDGDRYGLLAQDGSLALPVIYDDIRREVAGHGWVLVKDGLAWQVDFQLQVTVPFVHDGIHLLSSVDAYREQEYYDDDEDTYKRLVHEEPRFYRFDIGGYSGVMDAKGKVILPAIYGNVWIVNDNLFQVSITTSGEYLLFDTHGRYVGKSGI